MGRVSTRKRIGPKRKRRGTNSASYYQAIIIPTKYRHTDQFDSDNFFKTCLQNSQNLDAVSFSSEKRDSDGFFANEFYVILHKPFLYTEHDDLDTFVQEQKAYLYTEIKEIAVQTKLSSRLFALYELSESLRFVNLYDSEIPSVRLAVTVNKKLEVSITVHNVLLQATHQIWKTVPRKCVSVGQLELMLESIEKYQICIGNPDEAFQDLRGETSSMLGYKEMYNGRTTIRSKSCDWLIAKHRCSMCETYRRTLSKTIIRKRGQIGKNNEVVDWIHSTFPNSKLTDAQKDEKLHQLKTYSIRLEGKLETARYQLKKRKQKATV